MKSSHPGKKNNCSRYSHELASDSGWQDQTTLQGRAWRNRNNISASSVLSLWPHTIHVQPLETTRGERNIICLSVTSLLFSESYCLPYLASYDIAYFIICLSFRVRDLVQPK
jgi:hypothetical protein